MTDSHKILTTCLDMLEPENCTISINGTTIFKA